MDAALYAGALVAFTIAVVVHYFGRFRLTAAMGMIFWPACGLLLFRTMNPIAAAILFTLFGIAPALFVLVHAVDCERGRHNLPTFYSIPLAFLAGLALLFCCALGVAF